MTRRRFIGEEHLKVDAKGRMSIPAPFRRVLDAGDPDRESGSMPSMVIVQEDTRKDCLQCYTVEAMQEIQEMVEEMPLGSDEQKVMEQIYFMGATELTIDDTGRIVLSAKLRDKIGVTPNSELVLAGAGKNFRIWRPEAYQAEQVDTVKEWLDAQPKDFDPRSLLQEMQKQRRQRDAGGEA
ncbi:division/cell wall cluster transcriptional repressor MraZ [Pseudooceanicola nanhaiensis]|uniref:division/cell wall cluster transcriptional repressor MraZ n=1 Tax=Pseudooceanicola nanhaiensis TaxID=375761 RepID=UPI001CD568A8|nr:division/cell wall cluster transcriptional repressor MraZ [Pseudooceanicola nanhaiensis]MCA0920098.1 division/cell wall cluster transcriptional repressor MraZ [Pseudooceanicola nanhaiensis]